MLRVETITFDHNLYLPNYERKSWIIIFCLWKNEGWVAIEIAPKHMTRISYIKIAFFSFNGCVSPLQFEINRNVFIVYVKMLILDYVEDLLNWFALVRFGWQRVSAALDEENHLISDDCVWFFVSVIIKLMQATNEFDIFVFFH